MWIDHFPVKVLVKLQVLTDTLSVVPRNARQRMMKTVFSILISKAMK
jgi:hypothetical protein